MRWNKLIADMVALGYQHESRNGTEYVSWPAGRLVNPINIPGVVRYPDGTILRTDVRLDMALPMTVTDAYDYLSRARGSRRPKSKGHQA